MRTLKDERAVSPVIATVILVAVAITVAVAVAYWMGGIAGMYTQHEQIEILSDYAPLNSTVSPGYWNVTLELKNTGSAECTLRSAFVNDVPIGNYVPEIYWCYSKSGTSYTNVTSTGLTVASGEEVTVYMIIEVPDASSNYHFTSGTHININLHSAGGMDYPQLVELV